MQFEAAHIPEQQVTNAATRIGESEPVARVAGDDGIGERLWLCAKGRMDVHYEADVAVRRMVPDLSSLAQLDTHLMPADAVKYLFDSRYCPADRFQSFISAEFGSTSGGQRVVAMRDWIAENFAYVAGTSNAQTTAVDSFLERRGICRDYAHVMIAMARASTIPARYVSCYGPNVSPSDFHAVAEVFLADPTQPNGGAWHIVDATGMATAEDTLKIGVGRDAADTSFMTTFGASEFISKTIEVSVI